MSDPTGPLSPTRPRVIANTRAARDWNTCGQAAIATVLAHFRLGPFAGNRAIRDGEAIDAVARTHPPDLPLGLGTTPARIAAAFRAHGLAAERIHSGGRGVGPARAYERLAAHVAGGCPVPVCLDEYTLSMSPSISAPVTPARNRSHRGYHWAVVTAAGPAEVVLGNVGRHDHLSREEFFQAWACRHLPFGHHHCGVLAWP